MYILLPQKSPHENGVIMLYRDWFVLCVAQRTGVEPATSRVTGERSNQAELPLQYR